MEPLSGESGNLGEIPPFYPHKSSFNGAALRRERKPSARRVGAGGVNGLQWSRSPERAETYIFNKKIASYLKLQWSRSPERAETLTGEEAARASCRFNGAALRRERKLVSTGLDADKSAPLQWSRSPERAETSIAGTF